ncbi:MAG: ATP-grasp domain-containing protein [Gaiellaceae bacterium]
MPPPATACVIGSMDLVRPLALAGIRCAVVAPAGSPPQYSRLAAERLVWDDPWEEPARLVERLAAWAETQQVPPTLFYEEDRDLVAISRQRDRLAAFHFLLPPADLVEDLVDKARFAGLAERVGLPAPAARVVQASGPPPDLQLRFPLILKPLTRRAFDRWHAVAGGAKAVTVDDAAELRRLWPLVVDAGLDVLAQEAVPGPETRIESYHAYVDPRGDVVASFTGAKLRTRPLTNGFSTALVITDAHDVAALGREIVERLGLVGVLKADFKRRDDGSLALLEINPRFNLWHHLAARAGVNLPALVHADLTGEARPRVASPRPGATWVAPVQDLLAARSDGVPLRKWLAFVARADARSVAAWDDPLPFLRGVLWNRVRSRLA